VSGRGRAPSPPARAANDPPSLPATVPPAAGLRQCRARLALHPYSRQRETFPLPLPRRSLKPWLLEVNASPSLSADTDSDYRMKRALLSDMLDVLDLEGRRAGDEVS